MTRQILWIITLLFGFVTGATAHEVDEVEQALAAIGVGSTREIKDRIFGRPLTVIIHILRVIKVGSARPCTHLYAFIRYGTY